MQAIDTLIGDITPPPTLMETQTDRKIAEEQRKTFEVQQAAQKQRQELDLLVYLRMLEQSLIDYLAALGIASGPVPGLTGVWVGDAKVAAIGVKSNGGVVSHGFALNLTTDLDYFGGIVPCGLPDKEATSVERLTGRRIGTEEAARAYAAHFITRFGVELEWERRRHRG